MQFELEPYIPYRGNKFGIIEQIYNTIRNLDVPAPKSIVDAFTGGGSFAYFMARKGYNVVANDIDKSVIALHNACKYSPEIVRPWGQEAFTKENFKKILKDETAYGALIRCLWSFSNDATTYLTSSDKETAMLEWFQRGAAEPNARFKHIEDIMLLWSRYKLTLNFISGSYERLEVPEGYLCYADPPYANTREYRCKGFDHEKFYAWALNQQGLVLISEYSMPEPFVLVDEYFKWNEAGRGARGKPGVERLYANKPVKKLSLF